MNNYEEMLAELMANVSEEEREAMLAADDALDRLMTIRIRNKYGVDIECNPGGDRTKVKIDGVIMNPDQFGAWLMGKQLEEIGQLLCNGAEDSVDEAIAGPTDYVEIPSAEIMDILEEHEGMEMEEAVRKWLRRTYGHYLKKGNVLEIKHDADNKRIEVSNIKWGRKI